MKIPTDALILVADGEKALFLRNKGDEEYPNFEVERKKTQDNPPAREYATDRPGRMTDTGAQQKSAMDDTDWHALEKERFATDLADMLFRRAENNEFDNLIICAAPQTLGELRKQLHKTVEDRTVGEIDKDLTNIPIHEIEKHLVETD
tara:strand:+ start:1697 stop:2140 length:444 start_codon:yes stop_codon:yes gene_type:complete